MSRRTPDCLSRAPVLSQFPPPDWPENSSEGAAVDSMVVYWFQDRNLPSMWTQQPGTNSKDAAWTKTRRRKALLYKDDERQRVKRTKKNLFSFYFLYVKTEHFWSSELLWWRVFFFFFLTEAYTHMPVPMVFSFLSFSSISSLSIFPVTFQSSFVKFCYFTNQWRDTELTAFRIRQFIIANFKDFWAGRLYFLCDAKYDIRYQ